MYKIYLLIILTFTSSSLFGFGETKKSYWDEHVSKKAELLSELNSTKDVNKRNEYYAAYLIFLDGEITRLQKILIGKASEENVRLLESSHNEWVKYKNSKFELIDLKSDSKEDDDKLKKRMFKSEILRYRIRVLLILLDGFSH